MTAGQTVAAIEATHAGFQIAQVGRLGEIGLVGLDLTLPRPTLETYQCPAEPVFAGIGHRIHFFRAML